MCIRDRFWTSVEPDVYDYTNTYTAALNMRPDGQGTYWGNWLAMNKTTPFQQNVWTCIEHRVKLNAVGATDGEYSIWVNDAPFIALKSGAPVGTWNGGQFTPAPGGQPFACLLYTSD